MPTIVQPQEVSVLFVAENSYYKTLPGLDVWDEARNALAWPGGNPLIAHPPCRLWSKLRYFSTAPDAERWLAIWAATQVRQWGGVLEHPAYSTLWEVESLGLPRPSKARDRFDGWTLAVPQYWWGHLAQKMTWLYIVGATPQDLPPIPLRLGDPAYIVGGARSGRRGKPAMPKSQRSLTPPAFAEWLIACAERCSV